MKKFLKPEKAEHGGTGSTQTGEGIELDELVRWLLDGDVSIQYQTRKYLLGESEEGLAKLRGRIAREGWGRRFLEARNLSGWWGNGFYSVKWVSSHYTLLDLRYLEMEPVSEVRQTISRILEEHLGPDGLYESRQPRSGDVCVNGMFLNYAAYFGTDEARMTSIVDHILSTRMADGGFNCNWNQHGTVHSSMHTTLSVLEGFQEWLRAGYTHRREEILQARDAALEFLLIHHLYRSDNTGEVINPAWLMLSFPSRWFYDILRVLVYCADAGIPWDPRMESALHIIGNKQRKDNTWPVQAKHSGLVHFDMEKIGEASRFNTLRALRVMRAYGQDQPLK